MLTSYITIVQLSRIKIINIDIVLLIKLQTFFEFYSFPAPPHPCPHSVLGSDPGIHVAFSYYLYLVYKSPLVFPSVL